jgi:hypothetical protein
VKERRKKGREVLPWSRATYGAPAALACLLRDRVGPSSFLFSLSLSLSLSFSLSLSLPLPFLPLSVSFSSTFLPYFPFARRRKFRPPTRTRRVVFTRESLGFRLASAAEKVQRCVGG